MKENVSKKNAVYVTDGSMNTASDRPEVSNDSKAERIKKPIIHGLMAVVFFGCMYLIFKPAENIKNIEIPGLNDSVPQATTISLENDKQKAYEQELLEQNNQAKHNALTSLSDYWNEGSTDESLQDVPEKEAYSNESLNSYRNAQTALSSFYSTDNSETKELRKQLDELKEELARKEEPSTNVVDHQLDLMEKSYQMAAKYLPLDTNKREVATVNGTVSKSSSFTQKEHFVPFTAKRKNSVSALHQESNDSIFLADWSQKRNNRFYTPSTLDHVVQPKNSIKACIQETQTIIGETGVRLRLLEPAQMSNSSIPKGTILTANTKLEGGRLQLTVTSIELDGNIIPVDITIYDQDGQQGLYIPDSREMNALTEMAGNMSQQSGTSLMLTQSAGQQVAADLSRGVVHGISGYFAKKVKMPKVTVKAGHQLFLVSKK